VKRLNNTGCKAKKLLEVLTPNSWSGELCFIIGGGPSLQGFNFKLLSKYKTIGINKAFQEFNSTINYAMDYNFFDMVQYTRDPRQPNYKLHQKWLAYPGIKLFLRHDHTMIFTEGIYYVDELGIKMISYDLDKGIYPGNNSGFGALMVAIALGCRKIALLGYDFVTQGSKTHWHEGYSKQDLKSVQNNLISYRKAIDEFGPVILDMGIEVYNLNPSSALKSFPHIDLNTFIS